MGLLVFLSFFIASTQTQAGSEGVIVHTIFLGMSSLNMFLYSESSGSYFYKAREYEVDFSLEYAEVTNFPIYQ